MMNFKSPHCLFLLLYFSHDGSRENQDPGKPTLFRSNINRVGSRTETVTKEERFWRQEKQCRNGIQGLIYRWTEGLISTLCCAVLSHVWLFEIPWTVACRAPLSMGFSRQEYCSGLLCPPPGDLPDPGIKPTFLTSLAMASWFFTTWEAPILLYEWLFVISALVIISKSYVFLITVDEVK